MGWDLREPTPEQREKWRKIQTHGKLRFVLLRGVLGWGLPTAILTRVADFYLFKEADTAPSWLVTPLIFSVGGYLFGLLMWSRSEAYFSG